MRVATTTMGLMAALAVACGDDGARDTSDATLDAMTELDGPETSAPDTSEPDTSEPGVPDAVAACPLDASARAQVAALVASARADAAWLVGNTHGVGQFAGRGFGTAIPLTEQALLFSISLMQACEAPSSFVPYCAPPDPGATLVKCSQLECVAAGELLARAWVDALPQTLAGPDGEVTLTAIDARATALEGDDGSVALTWTNTATLTHAGRTLDVRAEGGAHIPAAEGAPAEHVALTLALALDDVALTFTVSVDGEGHATGTGRLDDAEVVTVADDAFTWSGVCAE